MQRTRLPGIHSASHSAYRRPQRGHQEKCLGTGAVAAAGTRVRCDTCGRGAGTHRSAEEAARSERRVSGPCRGSVRHPPDEPDSAAATAKPLRSNDGASSWRSLVPTRTTKVDWDALAVLVSDERTTGCAVEAVGVAPLVEVAIRRLQACSRQPRVVHADLTLAHLSRETRGCR